MEEMMDKKITILDLIGKKQRKEKIVALTAYDYPTALWEEKAGIDVILVGDSVAMALYGYENTLSMQMDTMINHVKAVKRGAPNVFLIADMPYMSYQPSIEKAISNAGRFMSEGGADAVKVEGGIEVVDIVQALVRSTIPVMGHIGLTPQSVSQLGGFKAQGRDAKTAERLVVSAKKLEEAGAFALVIECVPTEVAEIICQKVQMITINIGCGPVGDGQILIVHDLLGLFDRFRAKFVKQYAQINKEMLAAFSKFAEEVRNGEYPTKEHTYSMPEEELAIFMDQIKLKLP
jgi:3-methyl-2-oxobutanoate hydroxymethyltransferase